MASSADQFYAGETRPGEPWFPPPYRVPANASSVKLASSIVAATSNVRLYGFTVTNTNAAAQFAMAFDGLKVPSNGAIPLWAISVPAGDAKGIYFGSVGRTFDNGIVLTNSTTQTSLTIGAADCLFDVQYLF